MKIMPKTIFDDYIAICRCYWETGDAEVLSKKLATSNQIAEITPIDFLAVENLVDSIVRRSGFCPDATNEMIYVVLSVMGWEVADIVEEYPAD